MLLSTRPRGARGARAALGQRSQAGGAAPTAGAHRALLQSLNYVAAAMTSVGHVLQHWHVIGLKAQMASRGRERTPALASNQQWGLSDVTQTL